MDSNLKLSVNNHLHLKVSTLHTTQTRFLCLSLFLNWGKRKKKESIVSLRAFKRHLQP